MNYHTFGFREVPDDGSTGHAEILPAVLTIELLDPEQAMPLAIQLLRDETRLPILIPRIGLAHQ